MDIWVVRSLTFVEGLSQIDFGPQANTEQSWEKRMADGLAWSSGKTEGQGTKLSSLMVLLWATLHRWSGVSAGTPAALAIYPQTDGPLVFSDF